MQHGHVHAARLEAGRGFEAEQAAADDHRLGARLRGQQHGVDVVEVAIGEHAGQVVAGHRQDEGHRAGGDHQLVVALASRRDRRSRSSPSRSIATILWPL